MVSIIDYGMGNLKSVRNALNYLGYESRIIDNPVDILNSSRLILPGVGAFDKAMINLNNKNLIEPLNKAVLSLGIPILGICLGMQLLASQSEEGDKIDGLALIPGKVKKFKQDKKYKIPLMGFNEVNFIKNDNKLFEGIENHSDYYFVHSYHFEPENNADIIAKTFHGIEFVSSVNKDNIFGTQFHPEKSQSNGLKLINNFIRIK